MRGQRLADLHGLACLVTGAGSNARGHFDLGARILDGADETGSGLRGFAHGDRGLFCGSGNFAGLAQHAAR